MRYYIIVALMLNFFRIFAQEDDVFHAKMYWEFDFEFSKQFECRDDARFLFYYTKPADEGYINDMKPVYKKAYLDGIEAENEFKATIEEELKSNFMYDWEIWACSFFSESKAEASMTQISEEFDYIISKEVDANSTVWYIYDLKTKLKYKFNVDGVLVSKPGSANVKRAISMVASLVKKVE